MLFDKKIAAVFITGVVMGMVLGTVLGTALTFPMSTFRDTSKINDRIDYNFLGKDFTFSSNDRGKETIYSHQDKQASVSVIFQESAQGRDITFEDISLRWPDLTVRRGTGFISIDHKGTLSGSMQAGFATVFGIPMGNPTVQLSGTESYPVWILAGDSIRQKTRLRSKSRVIPFSVDKIVVEGTQKGITRLTLSGQAENGTPMDLETEFVP